MKYLKTYEENKYNKYMLFLHPNNNEIFFDELVKIENGDIYFRIKNKYTIDSDKWDNNDSYNYETINSSPESKYKNNLLYTSYSEEDCLEFIEMYKNSKKYNI